MNPKHWSRRECNERTTGGIAALDSLGGNSTLAEALVTFRLLTSNLVLASQKQRAADRCKRKAPALAAAGRNVRNLL